MILLPVNEMHWGLLIEVICNTDCKWSPWRMVNVKGVTVSNTSASPLTMSCSSTENRITQSKHMLRSWSQWENFHRSHQRDLSFLHPLHSLQDQTALELQSLILAQRHQRNNNFSSHTVPDGTKHLYRPWKYDCTLLYNLLWAGPESPAVAIICSAIEMFSLE